MNDATLLERVLDGESVEDEVLTEEVSRLVALARAIAEAHAAEPVHMPESSRAELRTALVREASARRSDAPTLPARLRERVAAVAERWAYSARVAGAGGLAAAVLSGGGVAMATGSSLPGDLFYDLKLAVEDVRLGFAEDGVSRGQALLTRADERIGEAARVMQQGDASAAAHALELADTAARDAAHEYFTAYLDSADTGVLTELQDWVDTTRGRLDLLPGGHEEVMDAVADLRTSLDRIGQRIEVLLTGACTSCDLGVHDDPAQAGDTARGAEADGTPPAPPAVVDLTVIPPADEPFQPCPCVPTSRPAPVGSPEVDPAPPVDSTAATEEAPPARSGGSDDPGADPEEPEGGGGPVPVPMPDPGPVVEPLPEPVEETVEDVLDQLPEPGPDPAVPDL